MTSPTPPATGWNAATNALIELLTRMECDALAGRPPGRTALDAAHAAIRSLTRPDSPSGWQLVPIEPTNRMKAAGAAHSIVCDLVYRDMLKHAPLPEPPSPRAGE